MMKALYLTFSFCLMTILSYSQIIDWERAPRNPVGYKLTKNHFKLKGDIYASSGRIFDKQGNLIYNFGTRYYYDSNGSVIGTNYGDILETDARGNLTKFQYKSGSTYTYEFNDKDLLIYEKNTYGDEKTHKYDSQNRLIETLTTKKGSFHNKRVFSYSNNGKEVIVNVKYLDVNNNPSASYVYHYRGGHLVKEVVTSGTFDYDVEIDDKGNKISFKTMDSPDAKVYETDNRYYSDANKPMYLEYGYYPNSYNSNKKKETIYINGKQAKDIVISKGIKPDEKLIYDGLTKTYYSIIIPENNNHTLSTRIPITTVISKGQPYISYAFDGKFVNYVDGYNRVKSRDFGYLGTHMIDYRVDQNTGRTYIVKDYKNIKHLAVKEMNLLTTDKSSIVYLRDLVKDNFFVIVKGNHIEYDKARFEYLSNGDPVIFIDDLPKYVLKGFKNAKDQEIHLGTLYDGELNNVQNSTTKSATTVSSNTIPNDSAKKVLNCKKGDCENGWGQIVFGDIVTDATFKDGKIHGVAYITYPNGSYYHGEYKNNVRDGVGYYKWSSGNVYIGEWKDGKQHGLGYTQNSKNEIVSAGEFENGKLIKRMGTDYISGKSSGSCMGNCSDGFGRYTYNNGDKYWGFFKNNQRFGIGTYLWNNNSSFTGAYTSDGKRNGYGIYTYVDTSVFKGMFLNDKIDGLGIMKYATSGNVVEGVFNNKGAKVKDY